MAAIGDSNNEELKIFHEKRIKVTEDKNAPTVKITDEGLVENYPLIYSEVWKKCKNVIKGFKKDKKFDNIMKELKKDRKYGYERRANPKSERSGTTYLYSGEIIDEIKKRY